MEPVSPYLEYTNLSPLITAEVVEKLVEEAKKYHFGSICVPPYWVKKARRDLGSHSTRLVTVVGFPLGYHRSEVKQQEMQSALREKINEVSVMLNLSAVKTGAYHWVKIEMAQFAELAHHHEVWLNVILEGAYLNEAEIRQTAKACVDAGADSISTASGFAPAHNELATIRLLREILPSDVGIKASDRIVCYSQALACREAGADRIGSAFAPKIWEEANRPMLG